MQNAVEVQEEIWTNQTLFFKVADAIMKRL